MKRKFLLLVILLSLINIFQTYAQEGTKQLMPNPTDKLYLLINPNGYTNFAEYGCQPNERLYIYLNAGEKVYIGMQFNDASNCFFRLRDPSDNIVIPETPVPTSGQGYIANYDQAISTPNGVKVNGVTTTGSFDAIVYTATTTGNHYIEFSTPDTRYIVYFNVTVTDANDNLITNPDNPNISAGRLWSYQWQLTNTSYTQYPVNTPFYIYTSQGFVNKVVYHMKPYHFVFVSNSYGCVNSGNILQDRQSMNGNAFDLNNISEHKIFLNDPDHTVFPNANINPPKVKAWFEGTLIYDYDYSRNPQLVNLQVDTLLIHTNTSSCPSDSTNVAYFKIETNVAGRTIIYIDVNGDGFRTGTEDTALVYNLSEGVNYIPWDLKDAKGNIVSSANIKIIPKFLEVGPTHFPIFDVEALNGISATTVRPFKVLEQNVYWDDSQLPKGEWGDDFGAMDVTDTVQLYPDSSIPRMWTYYNDNGGHANGNDNTMNTWFNAIDLGTANLNFIVTQDECVNEARPFIADINKSGPVNQDITFSQADFDNKFSDAQGRHIVKVKIIDLPNNGTLKLNGTAITAGQEILYADLDKITFTPDNNWFGQTSFHWNAYNGLYYAQTPALVNIKINTPPTISAINDQQICINSSTGDIAFTVNDAPGETDPNDLTLYAISDNTQLIDINNITFGGSGTNRTINITPKTDQSGSAKITVFVNDGFNTTSTSFWVTVGPSTDYTGATNICPGGELRLEALEIGADSYTWTFNNNVVSTSRTFTKTNFDPAQDTGIYTLTITKGACTGTRDIHVGLHHSVDFTGDTQVCDGGVLSLTAVEPGATYVWYKGTSILANTRTLEINPVQYSDAGNDYSLEVTKDGCTITSQPFNVDVINCTPPTVDLSVSPDVIAENGGQATITARLSNQWFYDVTVTLGFSGTATNPDDYTPASNTITIPAGQTQGSTSITSYYDGYHEGDETVVVDINSVDDGGNGAHENGTQQQTITIQDMEPAPAVTISATPNVVNENGGSFDVTVSLSNKTYQDVTVNLSYSGTADPADYNGALTTVVIPQGQTYTQFTVTVNNDNVNKGDRDIIIDVTSVTGGDAYEDGTQQQTVTIIDDDKPTVTLSTSPTTIDETGSATITATLSNATYQDVTVNLAYSGSATYGVDYNSAPTSITIPAGNTSNSITISAVDDDIHEPAETIVVDVQSVSGGDASINGTQQQTITINDNDAAPTVTLSVDQNIINENGGQAVITATLSSKTFEDVTVNLSFSGSATRTQDYNCSSSITIPAGSLSNSITLSAIDDNTYENNEDAIIDIASVTGGDASENSTQQITVTINDNDSPPTVSLSVGSNSINEGQTTTITATLSNPTYQDVIVSLSYSGSATINSDYTAANSITIPAGQSSASINLDANDDNIHEPTENVNIEITSVSGGGATESGTQQQSINIIDNDPAPVVNLSVDNTTITEGQNTATLTISLSNPTSQDVTVTLVTSGTATEGTDYTIDTKTVTIPAGSSSATVVITPIDDNVYNNDRTVVVDIDQVSGGDATENGTQQVTVTITDDDLPQVYMTVSTNSVSEAGGTSDITFHLTNATNEDVTIDLAYQGQAINGTDYQTLPASVTIPAGSLTTTITLTAIDDNIYEGDEDAIISITNVTGGHATEQGQQEQTITIVENDNAPNVSMTVDNTSIPENGGSATVTITLDQVTDEDVYVYLSYSNVAVHNKDYSTTTDVVVIHAGNTSGTMTINAIDDNIYEPDEDLTVTISNVQGGNATISGSNSVTVTIIDDDNPPTVSISAPASVNEDDGSYQVTFTLSNPTYQDVNLTLDYTGSTAVDPDDYTGIATATIPAESTSASYTITVVADNIYEPDEDVVITISQATGGDVSIDAANDQATTTILNDDPQPQVYINIPQDTITENVNTADVIVYLTNPTYEAVNINLATSGTAVEGTDYTIGTKTLSIPAGSTQASTTITPINDNTYNPPRKVNVDISSATGGAVTNGTPLSDAVTIKDDDIPYLSISASPTSINENGETATITLSLTHPTYEDVTVDLALAGDATNGSDYTIDKTTLTIPAGATSATATITANDDNIYEGDEQILVSINSTTGGDVKIDNNNDQTTVTIIEDEPAPKISLAIQYTSIDESAGTNTITATTDQIADEPITINLVYSGTATRNADYTVSSTITIPANQTQATTDITIQDDNMEEPDETINVDINSITGANATENGDQSFTVTILDNDNAPAVSLIASPTSINEGSSSTITAQLTNPTWQDVTVTLTYSGTASSSDYTTQQSITIPAGQTQNSITLTANDDNMKEPAETVIVDIDQVNGGNAYENGTQQQTITINDNDPDPIVTLSINPTSISENNQTSTVTVTLSNPTWENVNIVLATSGTAVETTDYNIGTKNLTITPGNTSASTTITSIDDNTYEGNKTVIVDIDQVSGGNAYEQTQQQQTLTIVDDDVPRVTISATPTSIAENGGTSTITVSIPNTTYEDVTVDLGFSGDATFGTDYQASATSVIIPKGSTSQTITITALDDNVYENNENIIVDVTSVSGGGAIEDGTQQQTITINEDEPAPTVTLSANPTTIWEYNTPVTITATIDQVADEDVVINLSYSGDATTPQDYTASNSITIPAGQLSNSLNINIVNDTVHEPDENLVVSIAGITGADATEAGGAGAQTQTILIKDDDSNPGVTLHTSTNSINENGGSFKITAVLERPTFEDVTVSLLYSGNAQNGGIDYNGATSITIPAGDTSASITVPINDDLMHEPDENIIIDIDNITGGHAYEKGTQQQNVTIIDNDNPPTVTISANPAIISENGGSGDFIITLSNPTYQDVTVDLAISGDAQQGTDYNINATSVTIPSGNTQASVTVTAIDNGYYQGDRHVIADISTVTGGDATENGNQTATITIQDDEQYPYVSLDISPASINETGGSATLSVSIPDPVNYDIQVDLGFSGTATKDVDYTVDATSLTISAGSTYSQTTINALGDIVHEPNESIIAEITNVSGGVAQELNQQKDSTKIIDDDAQPSVSLSASPTLIQENGGVSTLTLTLSNTTYEDVTVILDYSRGTAVKDKDFTAQDTVIIPKGQLSQNFTLTGLDDNIFEPQENAIVDVAIVSGGDAAETEEQTVTIRINSDDNPPTVRLNAIPDTITEGQISKIYAYLSNPTYQNVTVNLSYGLEAIPGTDFNAGTSITIPAEDSIAYIDFTSLNDAIHEQTERSEIQITNVSGGNASEDGDQRDTIFILDNNPVLVTLSIDKDTIAENNQVATGTVSLSYKTFEDVTVNLAFSGTATYPDDYSISSNSVTIPAGQTSATFTITSNDDNIYEPTESVIAEITNVSGGDASEDGDQKDSVFIKDNEPTTLVGLNIVENTVNEGQNATLILTLNQITYEDVTVYLKYSGTTDSTDFTAPLTVTIKAGQTQASTTIHTVDDNIFEQTESIVAEIDNVSGGGAQEDGQQIDSVLVLDNDNSPLVNLTVDTNQVTEGEPNRFIIYLSNPTFEDVTVTINLSGTAIQNQDYTTSPTTVIIPSGKDSAFVNVSTIDDNLHENTENVIADIISVSGGNASENGDQTAQFDILDNDLVLVRLDVTPDSINENNGKANINLLLTKIPDQDVNITLAYHGSATLNQDYTAPINVTIPAGQTSLDTTLSTIDDNIYEGDENVYVEIQSVIGSGAQEDGQQIDSVVIVEDELRYVIANPDHYSVNEDDTLTGNVFINDDTLNIYSGIDITLISGVNHGTLVLNHDGSFGYKPDTNYYGQDEFIYQLCNEAGTLCDTALVTINVISVNDIPLAVNDTIYAVKNEPVKGDVSTNDILGDPPAVFTLVRSAEHGSVTLNSDGSFTYDPDFGFTGEDTFVYRLCDENNDCDEATVLIIIPEVQVYIPHGFSPNGDGVNDYFVIDSLDKYPNNHIIIFNRWGDKVFEASPYNNDWGGTNMFGLRTGKGKLPEGTYFYILDLGEGKKPIKGFIYLKR